MNWLVNPTGKPDGFQAVDWLVELNNFYTKVDVLSLVTVPPALTHIFQVIYSGQFSNRTLRLMIKQSPLIEIFRATHAMAKEWLYLKHRTKKHGGCDMWKTMAKLVTYMAQGGVHVFQAGHRQVWHEIADQAREGLYLLLTKKTKWT
jgi:hypothetical protein